MVAKYSSASFYRKKYPRYNSPHALCAFLGKLEGWDDWVSDAENLWRSLRKKFDVARCQYSSTSQERLSFTVVIRIKREGPPCVLDVARTVLWDTDPVIAKLRRGDLPNIVEHVTSLVLGDEDDFDLELWLRYEPKHLHGPFYLYQFSVCLPKITLAGALS